MDGKGKAPDTQGVQSASTSNIRNIPKLLRGIIDNAKPINFREKSAKVTLKDYRVWSIDELQKTINKNDIGIYSDWKNVFIYETTHWVEIDSKVFSTFLSDLVIYYGVPFADARDFKFKQDLFNQFLSESDIKKEILDVNIVKINLKNGTLVIDKGHQYMEAHNKNNYFYYTLDFDYNPESKSPLFDKFITQSLPDQESIKFLFEYCGTIFIRNESETFKNEVILALLGKGSNGKSVLKDILTALFGGKENVTSYGLDKLTDENGHSRYQIKNKLLNFSAETKRTVESNYLKTLASGEEVDARIRYGAQTQIRDYAKIIVNLNGNLIGRDNTPAYYRRFKIIPFDNIVEEKDKDKMLAKKIIKNELSGVLNQILQALERYIKNDGNFTESKAINNALAKYKIEDNSVLYFLEQEEFFIATSYKPTNEIFLQYVEFCNSYKNKPYAIQTFNKILENAEINGEKVKITRGRPVSANIDNNPIY
jgi:putative DNA primase/helicase